MANTQIKLSMEKKEKIKVLFYNMDQAGVAYFRQQTPAMEMERYYSDDFQIEYNPNLDFSKSETIEYLKTFDIINYHRQLIDDTQKLQSLAKELKEAGTILVLDIDDYWFLHKDHPFYPSSVEGKMHVPIMENLRTADYITTTTDVFAEEIKKVTKKNNVEVLFNAIDPDWMKQFQNNWKPDPKGRVRITYAGGSSHRVDLIQFEGVVNTLSGDPELKDKFVMQLAGFDTEGDTFDITFNQDFGLALKEVGLWNNKIVKIINKTRGNVDMIPGLSDKIKNQFRGKVFSTEKRSINSLESVYVFYENMLTNNHKMIKNHDYEQWLLNYERNFKYDGIEDQNYVRTWTEKANAYASILNQTDIVLAPLADNPFNKMKSNLKQVECWTRKLPIVCSDLVPYNVEGRHMENCILVPYKSTSNKYWAKYLKRLILNPELRKQLGEGLYEDFKERYHLANVTKKRVEFYKKMIEIRNEKNVVL